MTRRTCAAPGEADRKSIGLIHVNSSSGVGKLRSAGTQDGLIDLLDNDQLAIVGRLVAEVASSSARPESSPPAWRTGAFEP
jgi:hypothetical protein